MTNMHNVTNQMFYASQNERPRNGPDLLAKRVTALALGILISISAFAISDSIGLVVTACTFIALITLFEYTGGEERNTIVINEERQRPQETWVTYIINRFRPAQARHVPVGTGRFTQHPFRGQMNSRTSSTDTNRREYEDQQRAASAENRAQFMSVLPQTDPNQTRLSPPPNIPGLFPPENRPYTAHDSRVSVGTKEVTRSNPVPGERVVVGSGNRR